MFAELPHLSFASFDFVRRIGHKGSSEKVSSSSSSSGGGGGGNSGDNNAAATDFFGCESMVFAAFLKGHHHLGTFALKAKLTSKVQAQAIERNHAHGRALALTTCCGGYKQPEGNNNGDRYNHHRKAGGGGAQRQQRLGTSREPAVREDKEGESALEEEEEKRSVLAERLSLIPELCASIDHFGGGVCHNMAHDDDSSSSPLLPEQLKRQQQQQQQEEEEKESRCRHAGAQGCSSIVPVLTYFCDAVANLPAAVPGGGVAGAWDAYAPVLARTTVVLVYPHVQFFNLRQVIQGQLGSSRDAAAVTASGATARALLWEIFYDSDDDDDDDDDHLDDERVDGGGHGGGERKGGANNNNNNNNSSSKNSNSNSNNRRGTPAAAAACAAPSPRIRTAVQLDIMRQLLQAGAFLERRHVAHRDIKPDNVLLRFRTCCGSHPVLTHAAAAAVTATPAAAEHTTAAAAAAVAAAAAASVVEAVLTDFGASVAFPMFGDDERDPRAGSSHGGGGGGGGDGRRVRSPPSSSKAAMRAPYGVLAKSFAGFGGAAMYLPPEVTIAASVGAAKDAEARGKVAAAAGAARGGGGGSSDDRGGEKAAVLVDYSKSDAWALGCVFLEMLFPRAEIRDVPKFLQSCQPPWRSDRGGGGDSSSSSSSSNSRDRRPGGGGSGGGSGVSGGGGGNNKQGKPRGHGTVSPPPAPPPAHARLLGFVTKHLLCDDPRERCDCRGALVHLATLSAAMRSDGSDRRPSCRLPRARRAAARSQGGRGEAKEQHQAQQQQRQEQQQPPPQQLRRANASGADSDAKTRHRSHSLRLLRALESAEQQYRIAPRV
jgi:serine/threonine protein kinase